MEIRQLRYFVEAARQKSISKAARTLHIVQPALTAQIKALEEELDIPLLIRSSRGVKLTPEGIETYRDATVVLDAVERMKNRHAKPNVDASRTIKVGIPNGMTHAFTAQLIGKSLSTLGVKVEVVEGLSGFLLELLNKRRIDVGVLFAAQSLKGLHVMPLTNEALGLVGPAGKLDPTEPRNFVDLAELPLILTSDRHGLGKVIQEHARNAGTVLNVHAIVDSVTEIKHLVAMGIGYTILAPMVYADEVAKGILSATSLKNPTPIRQLVTATWGANPPDAAVTRVLQLIQDITHDATWLR